MTITETAPLALFEPEWAPQILPDDSPRVRQSDPVESHLAADSITRSGRQDSQAHVLNDLRSYGRSAAWQIEERAELLSARFSPSRLRTAISELVEAGRVVRAGQGLTPRGRVCAMFEAVQS